MSLDYRQFDPVSTVFSVRDAAARLPNGEGTRAEICELLKDSQFLAPDVTSAQVPVPYPHCSLALYTCFPGVFLSYI